MDEKKCWLVVCVQSNREKKTYERLSALGFESFLPLQEETRRWSDRSKKVQRVVIPMVVFARIAPSERISVLRLPSVSRFMVLRGESAPAIIPDAQMERFRFMLDYSEEAVEMCSERIQPGEQVKVITIVKSSKYHLTHVLVNTCVPEVVPESKGDLRKLQATVSTAIVHHFVISCFFCLIHDTLLLTITFALCQTLYHYFTLPAIPP